MNCELAAVTVIDVAAPTNVEASVIDVVVFAIDEIDLARTDAPVDSAQ
jgi:hypothetical protein